MGSRYNDSSSTTIGVPRQPPSHRGLLVLVGILAVPLLAPPLLAQDAGHGELGEVEFSTSCADSVSGDLDHAVALLHHMTYPQAQAAFEGIIRRDSGCAMAHWGVAMTLFQPTWPTRPGPSELGRGWDAVQRAKSIEPRTPREDLYIASAEAFFDDPTSSDYWARIRRWESAMERLHSNFPDDTDATTLYALAHLATASADQASADHASRSAALLLEVLARTPNHPGAMHYLVHANDAPGRESERIEVTRRYEEVAPNNPHALHMPTHIYTRLGDWVGVVRGNLRAAEAALLHPAGERGELVSDEFPHAIEYLVYAYLQQGDDGRAAAEMERLQRSAPLQPGFKTAFHLASISARYALERRDWDAAAALVPREPEFLDWDRFAWPEAVTWFARGLGSAHQGNLEEARAAIRRLSQLEVLTNEAGEQLFSRNIRILRLEVDALLAEALEDGEASEALLREASEVERTTPKHAVTPGPTLPAMELLGDLLIRRGRPEQALAAFRQSMASYPGRYNSLLGAARAADAMGDAPVARALYLELLDVAGGGQRASLAEARSFAAGR
ncbi:MAG: tetratricopeptide repeat protein [Chloroflexi bacterium]|nr:tetratricopeptide repeat protein [Chloroflexota bacterium]